MLFASARPEKLSSLGLTGAPAVSVSTSGGAGATLSTTKSRGEETGLVLPAASVAEAVTVCATPVSAMMPK
ncbi:hypothetical protein KYC5002_15515 [Archangium violaceum]|uniref:hypothetical protein n=1 Tax=Archangium violaceum TaxID=83451 RepID=UPI002B2DFF68|nr:hypothetical protein KYC5002_15515 [Archangium gephyra]